MHAWSSGAYVLLAGFSGCPFLLPLVAPDQNGATSAIPGGFCALTAWAAHRHGGHADARGEQAVEHALAEPRGDARGHAMADDLLDS